MSPSNLTAIATIIVGFIAPYITQYVQAPDVAQFLLDGLHQVILAAAVATFAWVGSTPYNERVTRIVSAVIRYLEDKRDGQSNVEIRKLAIEIIKGEIGSSSLGWRGLVLRIPIIGEWLIGRMVDGAASGVKTVSTAKTGAAALKAVKVKNAS